jgi:hypothetical protein
MGTAWTLNRAIPDVSRQKIQTEVSMRLNMELEASQMIELKRLVRRVGARDLKELINHAVTIFEWAANEVEAGNEIAAVNEADGTYRVLVTPLLLHLSKRKAGEITGSMNDHKDAQNGIPEQVLAEKQQSRAHVAASRAICR